MSRIEKLRKSAASERSLGNVAAAANFERKISELERKSSALVPVQQLDTRAAVEAAWSAIAPETIVDVLCCVPGLQRKVRKTMPMSEALPLLTKNGAWLVGRTAELVHVQQTTANCAPLSTATSNKTLFI